jgi:hypothetical protein
MPKAEIRHLRPRGGRKARKDKGCPICGRPVVADYRPFCSRRCADADLGRWLGEQYRIPTPEAPGDIDPGDEG